MTLASVVIPAHNESAVISACLTELHPAVLDGRLEVVVVANGCTDDTADVARRFAGVRVLELAEGSKVLALRAGDKAVRALPRIYLDADVVLPLHSALTVADRLTPEIPGEPRPLAGRPPLVYDSAKSVALVRRYSRARSQMPAVLNSLWGAGVYALSAAGRARFDEFPDQVADDLFVDQLFAPGEIEIVDCPPVTVALPRRVRDLLKVLRRTYRGKAEHHRANAATARETSGGAARDVLKLVRQGPRGAMDAATYAGLVVTARLAYRADRNASWERDDSTRSARPEGSH
ncbi:MAG: glycosyltransferase [Catenulispora sp.]|nr:glycosyltransferase [Catenulispora sp.]